MLATHISGFLSSTTACWRRLPASPDAGPGQRSRDGLGNLPDMPGAGANQPGLRLPRGRRGAQDDRGFDPGENRRMNLFVHLVLRLVGVGLVSLACAIGWGVVRE